MSACRCAHAQEECLGLLGERQSGAAGAVGRRARQRHHGAVHRRGELHVGVLGRSGGRVGHQLLGEGARGAAARGGRAVEHERDGGLRAQRSVARERAAEHTHATHRSAERATHEFECRGQSAGRLAGGDRARIAGGGSARTHTSAAACTERGTSRAAIAAWWWWRAREIQQCEHAGRERAHSHTHLRFFVRGAAKRHSSVRPFKGCDTGPPHAGGQTFLHRYAPIPHFGHRTPSAGDGGGGSAVPYVSEERPVPVWTGVSLRPCHGCGRRRRRRHQVRLLRAAASACVHR